MLENLILSKTAKVGIIGLGYVGLPLALLCIEKGYRVLGIDIDENKIKFINEHKSYISDISDADLSSAMNTQRLNVSTNFDHIYSCHILIVCVPTPLAKDNSPNLSFVFNAIESISSNLEKNQLIIIESTLVPQTTRTSLIPLLEESDLKVGNDFFVSYSPERIDPGNKNYSLNLIPKLVSGYTNQCRYLAKLFYDNLSIPTFLVDSLDIAEMAKILENTYRDINIAFINEMSQICAINNLNIWDIIDAAASKPFGYQAFYPGPGVGGHCIPKDSTVYTYWAKSKGLSPTLAEYARKVNDTMPDYIIERLEKILDDNKKSLENSKIMILGVTYKKDVNDLRQSPAVKIIELLMHKGVELSFNDPLIKQLYIGKTQLNSIDIEEKNYIKQDCIILAVAHSFYKSFNFNNLNSDIFFDLTNTMDKNIPNLFIL